MSAIEESEQKFNINDVLKKVFFKVHIDSETKGCEVVYVMEKKVPRLFHGKVLALEEYLVHIFKFIAKYNKRNELLIKVVGPEEFVYAEDIVFKIEDLGLTDVEMNKLSKCVENAGHALGAKIYYSPGRELSIYIPFTLAELGFRRHYRLPSKSLLQKNVLIMAESQNITLSITQMFKYFPYNVDMSLYKYDERVHDLSSYDLLVIEDKLMNEALNKACTKVQQTQPLKLVVLGSVDDINIGTLSSASSALLRPVTQESIFELIVSVFSDEYDSEQFLKNRERLKQAEEIVRTRRGTEKEKSKVAVVQTSSKDSFRTVLENKKNEYTSILDISLGKKNTKTLRLNYEDELENFFDMFNGSDLYFRQIVNKRSIHKIKEFCIDLEKHSKIIGAQSILKFTEIISLIFVYDKVDLLPIYPGRYHIELKKLFKEMERYFS